MTPSVFFDVITRCHANRAGAPADTTTPKTTNLQTTPTKAPTATPTAAIRAAGAGSGASAADVHSIEWRQQDQASILSEHGAGRRLLQGAHLHAAFGQGIRGACRQDCKQIPHCKREDGMLLVGNALWYHIAHVGRLRSQESRLQE